MSLSTPIVTTLSSLYRASACPLPLCSPPLSTRFPSPLLTHFPSTTSPSTPVNPFHPRSPPRLSLPSLLPPSLLPPLILSPLNACLIALILGCLSMKHLLACCPLAQRQQSSFSCILVSTDVSLQPWLNSSIDICFSCLCSLCLQDQRIDMNDSVLCEVCVALMPLALPNLCLHALQNHINGVAELTDLGLVDAPQPTSPCPLVVLSAVILLSDSQTQTLICLCTITLSRIPQFPCLMGSDL